MRWLAVIGALLACACGKAFKPETLVENMRVLAVRSDPAELKPGVSKYIAPEALFWFRWAALVTLLSGAAVAETGNLVFGENYLLPGLMFQSPYKTIGVGMWLGIIMAANVWFIIWPNQQKALGLKPADDDTKAKAARMAMLASRTNFVLSIPMLYCMVTQFYLRS